MSLEAIKYCRRNSLWLSGRQPLVPLVAGSPRSSLRPIELASVLPGPALFVSVPIDLHIPSHVAPIRLRVVVPEQDSVGR